MENKIQPLDLVGKIIALEAGELNASETLELFSEAIKSGLINSLQGSYGYTASKLIQAGYLDNNGNILKDAD